MVGRRGPGVPSKDAHLERAVHRGVWTTLNTGNVHSSKTNTNKPNNKRKLHYDPKEI